jgi:LmbE family N-acetylglucosaminyl deacetylase
MNFSLETADLFIPDGMATEGALARTTHLGIGAHQDDLEIMAYHGILEGFNNKSKWFGGVTCTNGGGSSRILDYADFTDDEMMAVRREEQRTAAIMGQFGSVIQLDHPSSVVKDPASTALRDDVVKILRATRPEIVYTHNPADKHPTHIGIVVPVIAALRQLAPEERPKKVYGCEVWRDLDWMSDSEKVALNVSGRPHLARALVEIFDSQIAGGKRYDDATVGRRMAHSTYFDAHASDDCSQVTFAMDLTPLIEDDSLDLVDYVMTYLDGFRSSVKGALERQLG